MNRHCKKPGSLIQQQSRTDAYQNRVRSSDTQQVRNWISLKEAAITRRNEKRSAAGKLPCKEYQVSSTDLAPMVFYEQWACFSDDVRSKLIKTANSELNRQKKLPNALVKAPIFASPERLVIRAWIQKRNETLGNNETLQITCVQLAENAYGKQWKTMTAEQKKKARAAANKELTELRQNAARIRPTSLSDARTPAREVINTWMNVMQEHYKTMGKVLRLSKREIAELAYGSKWDRLSITKKEQAINAAHNALALAAKSPESFIKPLDKPTILKRLHDGLVEKNIERRATAMPDPRDARRSLVERESGANIDVVAYYLAPTVLDEVAESEDTHKRLSVIDVTLEALKRENPVAHAVLLHKHGSDCVEVARLFKALSVIERRQALDLALSFLKEKVQLLAG